MTRNIDHKTVFEKIRETAAHTIIYGVGSSLQLILGFLLIPLYTKYYEPEMYGIFALLIMAATWCAGIFWFGGSSALARSYYDYKDETDRRKAIDTAFSIAFCGALMQVALGVLLSEKISEWLFQSPDYSTHVIVAFVGASIIFINTLFILLLRFERRSKFVVILNLISVILSATLILSFLVILELGVMAPILGECLAQFIMLVIHCIYNRGKFGLGFNGRETKLQLQFGFSYVVLTIATYANEWVDRILLERSYSLHEVGIYAFACKLGAVVQACYVAPFALIWTPIKTQYHKDSNAREFYKKALTYYFCVGMIIVTILGAFAPELVRLIAQRADYYGATSVLAIIMAAYVINGALNILDVGVYLSRKVIYTAGAMCLAALLNYGLNIMVIPIWGYQGASVVRLVTFTVFVLVVFLISQKFFRLEIERGRLLAIGIGTVATLFASGYADRVHPEYAAWGKLGLMGGVGICFYTLFLTVDERAAVRRLMHFPKTKV